MGKMMILQQLFWMAESCMKFASLSSGSRRFWASYKKWC